MPPHLYIVSVLAVRTMFIFSMTIHQYIGPFTAQAYEYVNSTCTSSGNYRNTSAYKTNLNLMLDNLVTHASGTSLFYASSHGTGDNQVYGIFYCRFDIKTTVCHQCVQDAAKRILQECNVEKTAVIWYDLCTLRFAEHSMYSLVEDLSMTSISRQTVSNPKKFINAMNETMVQLINMATSDKGGGHANGEREVTNSQKVYCFVQCRPDTIGNDCNSCLKWSLNLVLRYSSKGNAWCITLSVNCMIKYDISPFLEAMSQSNGSGKRTADYYIIRAAIPAVAAIGFLLIGLCYYFLHRRQIQISKHPSKRTPKDAVVELRTEQNQVQTHDLQSFEIEKIEIATNNFSISNILGEGGFGVVYRGTLENGKQVAIKRLSKGLSQGIREFKTEVEVVARLQQRNLVQLLGYCSEGEERMLVYEYLVNLSLDKFLFDQSKSSMLTWPIRNNIIYGTARGLHYLHEYSRLTIIHRDLKTSNILLDDQFDPKIGDFGIARLVNWDETAGFTTKLVGTMGYMAPEYTNSGRFSVKSDVYSLGIIILEMLRGLKAVKYYHPIHGEGLPGTVSIERLGGFGLKAQSESWWIQFWEIITQP